MSMSLPRRVPLWESRWALQVSSCASFNRWEPPLDCLLSLLKSNSFIEYIFHGYLLSARHSPHAVMLSRDHLRIYFFFSKYESVCLGGRPSDSRASLEAGVASRNSMSLHRPLVKQDVKSEGTMLWRWVQLNLEQREPFRNLLRKMFTEMWRGTWRCIQTPWAKETYAQR